jgi:hypothetical protein
VGLDTPGSSEPRSVPESRGSPWLAPGLLSCYTGPLNKLTTSTSSQPGQRVDFDGVDVDGVDVDRVELIRLSIGGRPRDDQSPGQPNDLFTWKVTFATLSCPAITPQY